MLRGNVDVFVCRVSEQIVEICYDHYMALPQRKKVLNFSKLPPNSPQGLSMCAGLSLSMEMDRGFPFTSTT